MRPPTYLLLLGLILILAGSFAAGYFMSPVEVMAQTRSEPPASPWDARMLALDREALDAAYKDRLLHVFEVWMRDDTDQPRRAINGARQARHAYIEVMKEIEKRGQQK